jgi:hypothetical protein
MCICARVCACCPLVPFLWLKPDSLSIQTTKRFRERYQKQTRIRLNSHCPKSRQWTVDYLWRQTNMCAPCRRDLLNELPVGNRSSNLSEQQINPDYIVVVFNTRSQVAHSYLIKRSPVASHLSQAFSQQATDGSHSHTTTHLFSVFCLFFSPAARSLSQKLKVGN